MSRVLVVDDEKNVLKTISMGLSRYEYTVRQARSGPEALKILESDPCDFVVSDIRMFPMDGYTLASLIRKKYPQMNIILMSAYGFEDKIYEQTEFMEYPRLTKPFSVSELVKIIGEEGKKQ